MALQLLLYVLMNVGAQRPHLLDHFQFRLNWEINKVVA